IRHNQITMKVVQRLRKHERRNITTGSFDAYLLPPSGETGRPATEFQQGFNTLVLSYELLKGFFLPFLGTFIWAFIIALIGIGVLPVKKPFLSALPVLQALMQQIGRPFGR